MAITVQTRKMLWGRAGNRCAFPNCQQSLIQDVPGARGASVIGEEAHIVAQEERGPRGTPPRPSNIDDYSNLVLLCPTHHKLVDDHPDVYTVQALMDMKTALEISVASAGSTAEKKRQRDEELYASYVDEWVRRADLDHWDTWLSRLTSHGQPSLGKSQFERLEKLQRWLFGRIWPGRHVALEDSFHNFRFVLDDLMVVFSRHVDWRDDRDVLWTTKFYKITRWDPAAYERLSSEYEEHVGLVEDLALELTRAANYVCDNVRSSLDPTFRLDEGALLLRAGPMMTTLGWDTYRPEYRGDERMDKPYPGLDQFDPVRASRDISFRPDDDAED
jgi:hypothetical protein